jgi:hypothetical protein
MRWKGKGEKSDRPKKLIICVDRGRADEDRGWEGHVISRGASRSVGWFVGG